MTSHRRIILAVSGASGMQYALSLARYLGNLPKIELHGIISAGARKVFAHETRAGLQDLEASFQYLHDADNLAAAPASGSWMHAGMIVCPCSMATLAAIAQGVGTNLIHRAADVCLKERRPLVLVPRETPLNTIHLKNMLSAHEAGAVIMPPCPGFYHNPQTIEQLVNQFVGRVLEQIGIEHDLYTRWS